MRFNLEVTQQDIDNGIPGNPCRCAVALAIGRLFNTDSAAVGYARFSACCPEDVRFRQKSGVGWSNFIDRFDAGESVKPRFFLVECESMPERLMPKVQPYLVEWPKQEFKTSEEES